MCSAMSSHLQVESLTVQLGGFQLQDINLSCNTGEYHILMGPTGSGKSSLIKSILGLNKVQSGVIRLGNRDITHCSPEERRMGYVPQNYALFPHLDVEGNIRFGLNKQNPTAEEAAATINRLCHILKIEKLRNRRIHGLSGGERQKIAIGRALATQPELLLLDEPFSSIDEGAKRSLWFELKQIISEVNVTTVHITHNLEEAYTLGEQLSVMIDGRLAQSGAKQEIFECPETEEVARYLNYRNIFSGVTEPHPLGTRIRTEYFQLTVKQKISPGQTVKFCIRQQDIKIIKSGLPIKESLRNNVFSGQIVSLFLLPEFCLMRFRIDGSPADYDFEVKFPAYLRIRYQLTEGQQIQVALWEPNIIFMA